MKQRITTLLSHAETKEKEEREKEEKETEAAKSVVDMLHAVEEASKAERVRILEIEAKVVAQEKRRQEFNKLQALERLLEKERIEKQAKANRKGSEETLRQGPET